MAKKRSRKSSTLKKIWRVFCVLLCCVLALIFVVFCFMWIGMPHNQITWQAVLEYTVSVIAAGFYMIALIVVCVVIIFVMLLFT